MIKIVALTKDKFNPFFEYLNRHISENGAENNVLFLPLSKIQSQLDQKRKHSFESGFTAKPTENNWRKMWIALNQDNKIVGHVDIRPHTEPNCSHRVILGMGVNSEHRGLKIGQNLMEHIIEYCEHHQDICWLDLQVLSNNTPAISLYKKMKFTVNGQTIDMFRIDNSSYDYTSMALKVY